MNKLNDVILTLPIRASYRVENGKVIRESAEYADIPADTVARFLMQKFGLSPDALAGHGTTN